MEKTPSPTRRRFSFLVMAVLAHLCASNHSSISLTNASVRSLLNVKNCFAPASERLDVSAVRQNKSALRDRALRFRIRPSVSLASDRKLAIGSKAKLLAEYARKNGLTRLYLPRPVLRTFLKCVRTDNAAWGSTLELTARYKVVKLILPCKG